MGTQKNRLNETVLLSTQNICLILWVRKYLQFYVDLFCLNKPAINRNNLSQYPAEGTSSHVQTVKIQISLSLCVSSQSDESLSFLPGGKMERKTLGYP